MKTQRVHTFRDDALGRLDACGVADRVAAGEVSAQETVRAAIERARELDPVVHGLACTDFDRALSAGAACRDGAFAGVPTVIKDNTALAGLPMRFGHSSSSLASPTADGRFVEQMLDTGMVPIGKSRLPEFAFNVTTEYTLEEPVRNPWNLDYSAGGSSGGAAALVAAGVVPIAHATDAGGSIRIPAAACGLVGLKPSRGRIVQDVAEKVMPHRIAVQGVLTRSIRDTAHLLFEAERRHRNPRLRPIRKVLGPSSTRLDIGVLLHSPTGTPIGTETQDSVRATAELLESMGHRVTEARLPVSRDYLHDYLRYMGLLVTAITAGAMTRGAAGPTPRDLEATTRGLRDEYLRAAALTPLVLHRLRQVQHRFRSVFDTFDVLLAPVVAHPTPALGHLAPGQSYESWRERLAAYDCFAPLDNIAGTPALALPLHRTRSGLPLAAHFSAAVGDERTLLELAFELEQAAPWAGIDAESPSTTTHFA
ncbi:amidase [Nocardia rhizosphaerae]|uniref:amidase n=1 Tax=Nocardia rhizosphaerae TaxID=1691571 RepID=A0ABV8L8A9_9NOCA